MNFFNDCFSGEAIERNDFTDFVLSDQSFSTSEICGKLLKNPSSVSLLFKSENLKALFLSDLPERIPRLLQLFSHIAAEVDDSHHMSKDEYKMLAEYMINDLALPLVALQDIHETRGLIELLISLTALAYSTRAKIRRGAAYRMMLRNISNSETLMTQLLPHPEGAKLMKKIVAEEQVGMDGSVFSSKKALARWAQAAVGLCRSCRIGHSVSHEIELWDLLITLRDSLSTQVEQANYFKANQPGSDLPFLSNIRDEESRVPVPTPSGAFQYQFKLSAKELNTLQALTKREPTSISAVESILEEIESKEFFRIFLFIVKTFPCRVCLEWKEYTPGSQTRNKNYGLARNILPDTFSRIFFGEKLGPWRVCLSDQAFQDLISANKDDLVVIANKLQQMASGQWDTRSLIKPLSQRMKQAAGALMKIPLWRAAYGSKGRILWQVNVGYDDHEDCDSDSQIITVWRIGNKQEINDSVKAALQLQKLYSRSDIAMREISSSLTGSYVILPRRFSNPDGNPKMEDKGSNPETKSKLSDSDIAVLDALMNNKFYCMTGKVLDRLFSARDSGSIEFPFDISRKEAKIIKHADTSAFILGRSGTGKTTCLLFKLLARCIASREEYRPIRQIFLTRSSYLVERLKYYLKKLVDTQIGQPSDAIQQPFPLGQHDSLQESEDPLYGMTMYNLDEEQFPLVCTFDQFLTFVERCIKAYDRQNFSLFRETDAPNLTNECRLIDYNVFRSDYWPAMSHLVKGFEVDQIFAEILGVIKGSTSAKRDFKPLSRDEYLNSRTRVFTEVEDRDKVYMVYESYERKKTRFGDQDDIDRVVKILRALEADNDLKSEIQHIFDEVYVDELQDQKLLEIDLLFTMVRNPYGIHFAGDTAQCISRDSTFRFEDVKVRFFEHFEAVAKASSQPSASRPELSRLLENYRSHQGILSLAAKIVKMLCNGFPTQIDHLPPETGSYEGALPVVFTGFNATQLAKGTGLTGTQDGLSCFGAEQVILVRDDCTKKKLKVQLPSTLILTILDSKGLEFEDVVLFNFFTNSVWAAVRMKALKALSDPQTGEFDSSRYASLCSELKHLYVAVTRARKNLWIIEDDQKGIQNILKIWTTSRDGEEALVSQVDNSGTNQLPYALSIIKPGKSSKPEAWIKQGEILLQRKLYDDALGCFVRAGHKQGQNLANAHILHEAASTAKANGGPSDALYKEAGELFEQAEFYRMASVCWSNVGEFKKAADILQSHSEYGRAAPLYEKAKLFTEAVRCYDLVRQYDDAVIAYRKGNLFNELITYLQRHKDDISPGVRARYAALSNILLQRRDSGISAELLPAAKELLGNEKAQEGFYENFGYTKNLTELHITRKDYRAAFNLALREGKHEEALELCQNLEAASVIPTEQLLALYNYLQAQRLWSSITKYIWNTPSVMNHSASKPLSPRVDYAFEEASPLHAPTVGWNRVLSIIAESSGKLCLQRPLNDASPVGKFMQTWGSDIFDLYEFLNLTNTEKMTKVEHESEFPVDSLAKFAHMAGDILIGKTPFASIFPLFGVLEVPSKGVELRHPESPNDGDSVVHILKWSPLYPELGVESDGKNYSIMSLKQACENFGNWLTNRVASIGAAALAHFYNVISGGRQQQICVNQLLKGYCTKKLRDSCRYIHKIPSSKDTKLQINSSCRIAGLFCSFTRIYYHRKFEENASKAFQGQKRSILEALLAQLTFVSPSLHDHKVQDDAWSLIMTDPPETLSCKGGIADLFFYRFRLGSIEWNKRGYLSALLEERDLASRLRVLDPFFRRVQKSIPWHCKLLEDYTMILEYDSAEISHENFLDISHKIIDYHATRDVTELAAFHATLSLFETIALGLLMRTTKLDVLVPLSLRNKVDMVTTHIIANDNDRVKLEGCLVSTLTTLCHILAKIGSQCSDSGFQFTVCGRWLHGSHELLIRRALDFLGICMANMGVGCTIPTNFYNVLWVSIVEVHKQWRGLRRPTDLIPFLRAHPSSIDWEHIRQNVNELPSRLLQAYKMYDKDTLIVIEGLDPRPQPGRFKSLLDAGINLHPRRADRKVASPAASAAAAVVESIAMQTGPVGALPAELAEQAAVKIRNFWKKYQPQLRQKRLQAQHRAERLLTPGGTAEIIIENILPYAYPEHCSILEEFAIPLLTEMLGLQGQIELIHIQAKKRLNSNQRLNIDSIERIQDMLSFIQRAQKEIHDEIDGFKAGKGRKLRRMPIDRLKKKLGVAIKYAEKLQKQVAEYKTDLDSEQF